MKKRILSLILAFSILLSTLPLDALTVFAQDNILYGDANGNGRVDMSDVNLMEQYIDCLLYTSKTFGEGNSHIPCDRQTYTPAVPQGSSQ